MRFPSRSAADAGTPRTDLGKAMAEFVIAFPVFLVILVAVVDLGVNFGDNIQLGQGAREAVAAGAVADVGTARHCALSSNLAIAPATEHLICLTKAKTHLDPAQVRVKVFYEGNDGSPTPDYQPAEAGKAADVTMVLCVMSPEKSVSGLLTAVYHDRIHESRVTARVGVPVKAAQGRYPPTASERPFDGQTWSFCKADGEGSAA